MLGFFATNNVNESCEPCKGVVSSGMSRETLAGLKPLYEVFDFVLADFNLDRGLPLFLCHIVGVESSSKQQTCTRFETSLNDAGAGATSALGNLTRFVGHANQNTHHAPSSSGTTWYYDSKYKEGLHLSFLLFAPKSMADSVLLSCPKSIGVVVKVVLRRRPT